MILWKKETNLSITPRKSIYVWSLGGYLPCYPSQRESRQSAILFILSTAAAILTQTHRMKSPLCRYILL